MSDTCIFPTCSDPAERDEFCFRHAKYFAGPKQKKQPIEIAKVSEKRKKQLKDEKPDRDQLNAWFETIEKKECPAIFTYCWNCGEIIYKAFMRAAIAHILPKRSNQFPSVKTHPDNYLILGAGCGCHQEYDRSWTDAATMSIWPEAVKRFESIYPAIAEREKKNIPGVLLNNLKSLLI